MTLQAAIAILIAIGCVAGMAIIYRRHEPTKHAVPIEPLGRGADKTSATAGLSEP